MPRARNPDRERAFEIYKDHNGDIDLVEISHQLSLSPGTIRGWKSKDQWEQKLNGTFRKNTERSEKKNKAKKKAIAKDVEQMLQCHKGISKSLWLQLRNSHDKWVFFAKKYQDSR